MIYRSRKHIDGFRDRAGKELWDWKDYKGHEETLISVYVHYHDYSDGFTGICIYIYVKI